jgi:hypothetical protein
MTCPTVEITGRKVFLVSGYCTLLKTRSLKNHAGNDDLTNLHALCFKCNASIKIEALQKLRRSAKKNPDAVAFGYVMGRWVPAA